METGNPQLASKSAPAESPPRLPVALVHGLDGFDQWRIELFGRTPLAIDYFRGARATLRAAGVEAVHCAALPPRGSVAERAEALRGFIEAAIPGGGRLHIIAHSMGGLDARHYITHLGGAGRVASLTTLGTPHRGSALASLATDYFIDRCEGVVRRMGLSEPLRRIRAGTAAHRDLRPDACARFNRETPDRPEVAYFSWGGIPPPGTMAWALLPASRILAALPETDADGLPAGGPNDGLVTAVSARWSGWRGAAPADHLALAGWQFSPRQRRAFDVGAFYRDLLRDLAEVERSTSHQS